MIRKLQEGAATITLYEDEYSRRLRVDEYQGQLPAVLTLLLSSLPPWCEKLIVKSRPRDVTFFQGHGLTEEAKIGGYFSGVDMHFMTKYFLQARSHSAHPAEEEEIIRRVIESPPAKEGRAVLVERALPADASQLAALYAKCFRIYPTPVSETDHILKTMTEGTLYVCVRDNGRIVSAASAEINEIHHNAELTDCATAEGYEGKGLMRALLLELERLLRKRTIKCFYTIARSESFGMNKVFHQLGYTFGGRMTRNCMIYSGLEDMNVWWKYYS